ncbi:MAG: ECF-type sigma factor [Blastocatellia bacterium]
MSDPQEDIREDVRDRQSETHEVTEFLRAWRQGDRGSYDRLIEKVHKQLHQLAERQLSGRSRDLLRPTELVNMAYLKLMGAAQEDWRDRRHFFGVAARAMRWLVMDWVRKYRAREHRGEVVSLDQLVADQFEDLMPAPVETLLAFDEALTRLEEAGERNERKVRLVELRCFGGFSVEEAADLLEVDRATAYRDWKFARAWLHLALTGRALNGKEAR